MKRLQVAKAAEPPTFDPWLGDVYAQRLRQSDSGQLGCCEPLWHVMGESHYGDPGDAGRGFTKKVILEKALEGYDFFDTLLSIVLDTENASDDRKTGWSKLAFSNFVQESLAVREDRSKLAWEDGASRFFGQLALTRPRQLLVVGAEQWGKLPSEGFAAIQLPDYGQQSSRDDFGAYVYEAAGSTHVTLATWIYHPSSRGKLDIAEARRRVRDLAIASCNIRSDFGQDEQGWFYDPAPL